MTQPSMAVGGVAQTKTAITIPPQSIATPNRTFNSAGLHLRGSVARLRGTAPTLPPRRLLGTARGTIAAALLSAGLMVGTTLAPVPQAYASSQTFPRLAAFDWAKTQAGKPYEYGGTGPNGYDCSGLVWEAYRRAGFTLPRTTQGMLASSMLGRTDAPNPGELAFYGSDHVEFVTTLYHVTYGALRPGTVLGWHTWYPGTGWQPTVYMYVKGAH